MTPKLTAEAAVELTARWHDQTLDLESLNFDDVKKECVFTVIKQKPNDASSESPLLQTKPLQHCRVRIRNVTCVQTHDAEGEVELYINEVETSPSGLRVKAVNGTLEVFGDNLEVSLDVSDAAGETEIKLATPLGDVSWRRKQTKPPS